MKKVFTALILFLIGLSVWSAEETPIRTRCGFKPLGDSSAPAPLARGCLSVQQLQDATATEDQRKELTKELESLGADALLKNCKPTTDTSVVEIEGKMCAQNKIGKVCFFQGKMNCAYKGKIFQWSGAGACSQQKCSTFSGCMGDKVTEYYATTFSDISIQSEPEVWINPETKVLEIRK